MSKRSRIAVGEIEPAVRQDVDLAAVQDRDRPDTARAARQSRRPACVTPVDRQVPRRRRMRRVVGDRHVLVAERDAALHHRFDRIAAVAPGRVHVQVAANVGARHERRQLAAACRGDFLVALANFRRDAAAGRARRRSPLRWETAAACRRCHAGRRPSGATRMRRRARAAPRSARPTRSGRAASAPAFAGSGRRTPTCIRSMSRYRRRSAWCSTRGDSGHGEQVGDGVGGL